jgi:predicted GNAT family acetyltransferase
LDGAVDEVNQAVTTEGASGAEDSITVTEAAERHRYELRDGEDVIGVLSYRLPDDQHVDLVHTEVDEAYGGRGLAGRLVAYAIADISAKAKRVIPHCPYVQSWLKKHPGYADITDWPHD